MNRLEEIVDKLSEDINIHFGGDEGNPFYRGWKNGVYQAFEALKPEIELMLKEQADMFYNMLKSESNNAEKERDECKTYSPAWEAWDNKRLALLGVAEQVGQRSEDFVKLED